MTLKPRHHSRRFVRNTIVQGLRIRNVIIRRLEGNARRRALFGLQREVTGRIGLNDDGDGVVRNAADSECGRTCAK